MAIFLIVIIGGWATYEAIQHYKAERYAQKMIHNIDIDFLSFMLSNHPLCLIWIVLAIILFIGLLINSI